MCRSRAEGGQRCLSHAKAAADRAADALTIALTEQDENPTEEQTAKVLRATQAFHRAQVDLASTPAGRAVMEGHIANPLMQSSRVEAYSQILREAEVLRDRNDALKAAHADLAAGRSPLATGGGPRLDQSIAEAHQIVLANLNTARRPTPGLRIAKVKAYETVGEQRQGLVARLRTLNEAEFDFANLQRQVRAHTDFDTRLAGVAADAGDPSAWAPSDRAQAQLDGLTAMRDEAAVRLIILADRFAKAKAQDPPGRLSPFNELATSWAR